MSYHIFIDFDGTITVNDVGYEFFKHFAFGKAEQVVQRYRRGEINAVECLQTECDIYNEYPASAKAVKEFIGQQRICEGFVEFIQYCRSADIKVTILSAGFDFYIAPILNNLGLDDLEVFATPTFIKNGRIYPEFVRYDESICPHCADCKGQRIKELAGVNERSVFIGDGHSDSHGASAADIVFAKSFLAEYLDRNKIKYIPFENFNNIIETFKNKLQ